MTITFMIKNDAEWYDKMFFVLSCMALLLKLKHYNITYQYEKKRGGWIYKIYIYFF